ncbi:MAG: UbiX family flavin prenyltransferase [Deltaproteobacteria bacterium]|nr:UbiX family flavin prenyltransferase [Deltaproteobacteria bacterium]
MKNFFLAISGASGAVYAKTAVKILSEIKDIKLHGTISPSAIKIFNHELGNDILKDTLARFDHLYEYTDVSASVASGSFPLDGAMFIPCSLSSAMSVSCGLGTNLPLRVAQVCLKERRSLLLMVRESPLDAIHLENLAKISRSGGIVMTASPEFYTQPKTINDLALQMIYRSLSYFDINIPDMKRWNKPQEN